MIRLTIQYLFAAFLIFGLPVGCSKADNGGTSDPKNPDGEARMSTYSFTFTGGDLDGQTISGIIPDNVFHGGGLLIAAEYSNSSLDELNIHIGDDYSETQSNAIDGTFLYNENGEVLPVGNYPYDIMTHSTLTALLSLSETESYTFASVNGTTWVSDLVIGPSIRGTA